MSVDQPLTGNTTVTAISHDGNRGQVWLVKVAGEPMGYVRQPVDDGIVKCHGLDLGGVFAQGFGLREATARVLEHDQYEQVRHGTSRLSALYHEGDLAKRETFRLELDESLRRHALLAQEIVALRSRSEEEHAETHPDTGDGPCDDEPPD